MKKLLIFLLLFSSALLNAQEVRPLQDEFAYGSFQIKERNTSNVALQYGLGYGSFKLEDIKTIQGRVKNTMSQYGARITENFPNYFIQSVAFGLIVGQHHTGIRGSFLTTGGRVHVSDYSGEYKADMLLSGVRFGLFYRYYIPNNSQWFNIYLQIESGILSSNLKMNEKLVLGSRKILEENFTFKSKGAYFEPSIGVCFKPLNWLHLSLGGGYEIDTGGKMKLSSNNNKYTYRGDDKINWNGFRFNAGLILIVPKE